MGLGAVPVTSSVPAGFTTTISVGRCGQALRPPVLHVTVLVPQPLCFSLLSLHVYHLASRSLLCFLLSPSQLRSPACVPPASSRPGSVLFHLSQSLTFLFAP